ncbi:unnamed protein product [Prunus armeniaca]
MVSCHLSCGSKGRANTSVCNGHKGRCQHVAGLAAASSLTLSAGGLHQHMVDQVGLMLLFYCLFLYKVEEAFRAKMSKFDIWPGRLEMA